MTTQTVNILDEHVDGAVNFRDLGGYSGALGRVRRGRVYRAGMTHHLSEAGLMLLRDGYGMRTVIDLRTEQEMAKDGVAAFHQAGIRHIHAPVFASLDQNEETRRVRLTEMREGRYDWSASYRQMITDGGDSFRQSFSLLADAEALPLAFHCTAGRDRTGVTAALLLSLLGVERDVIAHDYALTGTFLRPHVGRFLRPDTRTSISEEQMLRILETSTEAMASFLTWLGETHGSAEGYLRGLGLGAEQIGAIRRALLEPAH